MRTSVFMVGALMAAGLSGWLLFIGGERSFEVKGRVVGFGDDGRTMIVEHEAVPGYMPAMTMPFKARAANELEGLELGDAVGFRLVVTSERSWIERVERLPQESVAAYPAAGDEPKLTVPGGMRLLGPGDAVPEIVLIDQDGEPLHFSDYRGKALVVNFIYTRCPIPDYCPLLSRNFQRLQSELAQSFVNRVHLLSISFDPENDTPAVLQEYAQRYTEDLGTWTFATGLPEELGRATALFGVHSEEAQGQIVHNLTTALIGPDGRLVEVWRGNDWKPEDVLQSVARLLGHSTPTES